jgi:hypothetical protein
MNERIPASLNELIKLARGTRFESAAADEKKLEELLLKEMQASDDPMTREIGSGIAGGSMTWHTVATNSAYSDYVDSSVEAMQRFDFTETFDALAAEQAEAERKTEQAKHRDDEDEPFSRGVLKRRGGRPQR